MQLISLVGSAGSGKNAIADILKRDYGFTSFAFAGALKDAVAALFCWPRHLLEGDTDESRLWRETVQPWWAEKLGMPDFTPRMALQRLGTDLIRQNFHPDMWLLTVERAIHQLGDDAKVVITDARFPNELSMTTRLGGRVVRVKRGADPHWWNTQLDYGHIADREDFEYLVSQYLPLKSLQIRELRKVHLSERAWVRSGYDHVVENDGSLDDLQPRAAEMLTSLYGN